jgi:cell shape-determining protein MreC
MASNCLIGRIIGKQQNIYQILSIADPNFRLPAITQESQVFGMLYGGKTPKFIPFSNNNKEKINPNEPLLTISSTENFPPNIPIGTINTIKETFNIQTNCNNYHHYAFVL